MAGRRTYGGRRKGRNHWRQREPAARRVRPRTWRLACPWKRRRTWSGTCSSPRPTAQGMSTTSTGLTFVAGTGVCGWSCLSWARITKGGLNLSEVATDHVRVYLKTNLANRHRSVSWLCCAVAAVRGALEFERLEHQVDWGLVGSDLRKYRRKAARTRLPKGADGITRELFEMIEAAAPRPMDGEWPDQTRRRAAFDLALISLMRDCLLRRSEAAAVTWGDIKVERKPGHVYGSLTIPNGKTDPYGNGEVAYIHVSTLARLQEMAVACGRDPNNPKQLVFEMSPGQMARRIKKACAHAGLMGKFSGHSPRVGMAIDLATYDTPLVGVMQSGRWRIPSTVMRYIRSIAVGDGAVSRLHHRWNRVAMSGPVPAEEWK